MAAPQRFRSAFNGFNREDVVNYIEYLNNHYTAQLEQLNNQLQEAKNTVSTYEVTTLQAQLDAALQAQLENALQRCAELEEKLNAVQGGTVNQELETYRRAEEVERKANERAREIYAHAQSTMDGVTSMAQVAVEEFNQVAERTTQQMKEYQEAILATANNFQSAVAALNDYKPE